LNRDPLSAFKKDPLDRVGNARRLAPDRLELVEVAEAGRVRIVF